MVLTVSDSDLVDRLREILRTSDLETTTSGAVRRQLEQDFGIDLSDRKRFITDQIDDYLQCHMSIAQEGRENPEEDGENVEVEDGGNSEVQEQEGEEEEEEEEGSEEEEVSDEKQSVKKKKSSKVKAVTDKKRTGGGFTKVCSLSEQLQDFVGVSELARTEVVKRLWAYIRENNLQDPTNKRNINCDEKLHAIFRVDTINMFQMNKALTKHIWPLEAGNESSVRSAPKEKQQKRRNETEDKPKQKAKRQKGAPSGFLAPLQLSEALMKFLGTGEAELPRTDIVKRMWDYIKQNDLQDPSDKRRILCDDKLKELFDVDSFQGFSVTKLLIPHLKKAEQ